MAKAAVSIPRPSLPQKDNLLNRAERDAQLLLVRDIYDYSNETGLPMPLAAGKAAVVQLPGLVDWVEGQGINQAKIFADIELWKFETSGSNAPPAGAATSALLPSKASLRRLACHHQLGVLTLINSTGVVQQNPGRGAQRLFPAHRERL